MQCPFCKETINDSATVCPHCRRDQAAAIARKREDHGVWIVPVVGLALLGLLLLFVIGTPRTYGDIAAKETADCIRYKGNGAWVGSSGVTLEQFCKSAGQLKALEQERQDHPERF